jgi:hypothetical protein
MICQVDDRVVESLRNLKGEQLQLNHYRFGDNTPNDGFVISGASDYFFIRTHTKVIDNRYELHLLTIDQVWEQDVDDDLMLDVIEEGELAEIHIFSHSISDLRIDRKIIEKLTSECACMLNFREGMPTMIYPKHKLFGSCTMETDTDRILDVISSMKLQLSRTI